MQMDAAAVVLASLIFSMGDGRRLYVKTEVPGLWVEGFETGQSSSRPRITL